ncbi:MAG: hypothetical protein JXQ83_14965 [Candidatus Glassbacteria bacterium]|nr:hypothetical protein [Candidatus Glassbacteria bacterium]
MDEERERKNEVPDSSAEEPPEREPVAEAGEPEEVVIVPEDSPGERIAGEAPDIDEEAPDIAGDTAVFSTAEQFVDFDVWVAALEANFGPDFENVLHDSLGPDWHAQINSKMLSGENFYNVVQGIKKDLKGGAQELDVIDEDHLSFEALSAEGGYGSLGDGPGGGGGPGGEGDDSIPLADLHRKEFMTQDKFKLDTKPEDYEYEKVLRYKGEGTAGEREEEVVLVDRSDFEQLSYYAHKEKERHKDDIELDKVLKRDSLTRQAHNNPVYRIMAAAAGVIFLYALLCVVSTFACGFYSRGLLKDLPPDMVFRPSTALHKQGELSLYKPDGNSMDQPLIYYTLRPAVKKMDLRAVDSGTERRFELAACNPSLIVMPRGPRGDSVTVRKHYREYLPSNLAGLLHTPCLSLTEESTLVLEAYETASSSLLPGLLRLEISDGQGSPLGRAYRVGDRLNILLDTQQATGQQQLQTLRMRLVLLFSLLDL